MNRLFVTGDTHNDIDINKLTTYQFPVQKELDRDDYLIIAGDFGGVWYGNQKDNWILNWHNNKNYTTLFVDGNHENFDALNTYKIENWHGGKVQFIRSNVIHLMRGQIYDICGYKVFTFGGASSTDKETRREHISWWAEENSSYAEQDEALQNLQKLNNTVDIIVSHAGPQDLSDVILQDRFRMKDPEENFLQYIADITTFKKWYFGHYHKDAEFLGKYTVLYQEVEEVKLQ